MTEPKIDMNLSISKNLKIIYGGDSRINSKKEAEMAEAFLKLARPKQGEDTLRLYQLKQSLNNYYALGDSAVLLHYTQKAYQYLKEKGNNLYSQLANYINNGQNKHYAQAVK